MKKKTIDPGSSSLFIGLNWGAKKEKGWFDGEEIRGVDLDLGAFIIKNNQIVNQVFYANTYSHGLVSATLSIDDNTGDLDGNDNLDNEIITINFNDDINDTYSIVFFLNSYSEFPFGDIPYVECRIYDGMPNLADNIYLKIDYSKNMNFKQMTCVIIGKLVVQNRSKELTIINEFHKDTDLFNIKRIVEKSFLSL